MKLKWATHICSLFTMSTTKLEGLLPNLKPCTKYQITLDLNLNEANDEDSNEVDYMRQNFAAVHTMPTKKSLDSPYFNPETKTLNWDFNELFNQDCTIPSRLKSRTSKTSSSCLFP